MLRTDGDILVFKAGFAAERAKYKLNFTIHGLQNSVDFDSKKSLDEYIVENSLLDYEIEKSRELGTENQALWNLRDMINNILEGTKEKKMEILLSGGENWRYKVFPEYKSNRNKSHRPYYEKLLKDHLVSDYGAEYAQDEEADDQMGIRQYKDWYDGNDDSIIATLDKDLNMIPGLHYNWDKGTMTNISLSQANRWFYMQVLMGDPADGIPGLPKVGIKTAERLLSYGDTPVELYQNCIDAYANYGVPVEKLHQYARVLWIRRKPGEMWEAPL